MGLMDSIYIYVSRDENLSVTLILIRNISELGGCVSN